MEEFHKRQTLWTGRIQEFIEDEKSNVFSIRDRILREKEQDLRKRELDVRRRENRLIKYSLKQQQQQEKTKKINKIDKRNISSKTKRRGKE